MSLNSNCNGTINGCCPGTMIPANEDKSNCPPQPYIPPSGGCSGTQYGCCADGVTPKKLIIPTPGTIQYNIFQNNPDLYKANPNNYQCNGPPPKPDPSLFGTCAETQYGCCPNSKIPKNNILGTNCGETIIINVDQCKNSLYGCCPDGKTVKIDENGSNCPKIVGGCSGTQLGCCPDNITAKTDDLGSNCIDYSNLMNLLNEIDKILLNPLFILLLAIFLVIYVMYNSKTSQPTPPTTSNPLKILGGSINVKNMMNDPVIVILFLLLFIQAVILYLYYYKNWNIYSYIKNLFVQTGKVIDSTLPNPPPLPSNPLTPPSDQPPPVPEIKIGPQVFNIPENVYSYEDAKSLCQAYGSRLATYEEVENAYNKGAEWCNYGWSQGQMILFPTQTSTYNDLQKIPGHEHDCGRPGVNGGYIANPHAQFGANCFGYKPKINKIEQDLMAVSTPYPLTEKDILFEKRVNYWKSKLNEILVSPFNYNTWSRF